jgi:hypothetical protein
LNFFNEDIIICRESFLGAIRNPCVAPFSGMGRNVTLRSGIYIVPTNQWYIERTVWLIAGIVLIAATALAVFVQPLWALLIIATGAASVTVALTGFCVVGNVLKRFGFSPMLGTGDPESKWYIMQTDRWYLERRIYLAVGINISIASVLSMAYSPWWLAFTGFVGVAMVWFAVTGFCIMANGLYWLGAEPRLAPAPDRLAKATELQPS